MVILKATDKSPSTRSWPSSRSELKTEKNLWAEPLLFVFFLLSYFGGGFLFWSESSRSPSSPVTEREERGKSTKKALNTNEGQNSEGSGGSSESNERHRQVQLTSGEGRKIVFSLLKTRDLFWGCNELSNDWAEACSGDLLFFSLIKCATYQAFFYLCTFCNFGHFGGENSNIWKITETLYNRGFEHALLCMWYCDRIVKNTNRKCDKDGMCICLSFSRSISSPAALWLAYG